MKLLKKLIHEKLKKIGYQIKPYKLVEEINSHISYSQCGEDIIVEYIFRLRGIERPTYIDIGANHPYFISNTALFYKKGSRGINIEASQKLYQLFVQYRPDDINLNVGIGASAELVDFYIMKDNTLNTFSKVEYNNLIAADKELEMVSTMKLTTVENVLQNYYNDKCPDFLSLDVEGLDYNILQSIDFIKYSPKVICVEAAEYSPKGMGARRNELVDFLVSKNYYEYANTNLNAIMVRRDFWFI